MNYLDLSGKVAVVTGSARGIGAEIAYQIAACGAQVVIADILPVDDKFAAATIEKIAGTGLAPHYIQCDISKEEDCKELIAETIRSFGKVDIVVNDAAIAYRDFIEVFKVNTLAQYYINTAAYEDMKKRGYGKIVNITTSGTFSGGGSGVEYNATKGGADSLTRFLAKQFAADGINVNAIAPGPILTELMKDYWSEDKFEDHYLDSIPKRKLLCPADIAKVVLFLVSELSDALCGETILADAGRVRLNP